MQTNSYNPELKIEINSDKENDISNMSYNKDLKYYVTKIKVIKRVAEEKQPALIDGLAKELARENPILIDKVEDEVSNAKLARRIPFNNVIKKYQKTLTTDSIWQNRKPTDDEISLLWISKHKDTVFGLGFFRRQRFTVYEKISDEKIINEITDEVIELKPYGIKPTASLIKSILYITTSKIKIEDGDWDKEEDILPCKNGFLRLSTRELLPIYGSPFYFTKGLDYEYDPQATCPNYVAALNKTIPGAISFFQEFMGYCVTTETKYETTTWLVGPSGSGKSTIIHGLNCMLGPRSGVLGLNELDRNRFSLFNLIGWTLASSYEQPNRSINSSDLLNSIISGEPIQVEEKYRQSYTYAPKVKLIWAMNNLPSIADVNNGIFRRLIIIRFNELPINERNVDLKIALSQEKAGILNYALDGLDRLRSQRKFSPVEGSEEAVEQYRTESDIPAKFVEERCLKGNRKRIQSQILYDKYVEYCDDNGFSPIPINKMAKQWKRLGFNHTTIVGLSYWKGITLKE